MTSVSEEKSSYSDIIATDLLPSTSATEGNTLFEETYNSTSTAVPCDFLNRRQRSVSQSLILESQQQGVGENGELDFLYNTEQIGSLLGSIKLNARERAESDFASYTTSRQSLLSAVPKPIKQTPQPAATARPTPILQRNKEEEVHKKSPLSNNARKKRKDDWVCPSCGNRNYSWRNVCNMRKCRAPKPGNLLEPVPPGSWHCLQCGNMNYAERMVCNMRKCRAPRPVGQNIVPRYQFSQQQFPVATAYPYAHALPLSQNQYGSLNGYFIEEQQQPLYTIQNTLENETFTDYNVR